MSSGIDGCDLLTTSRQDRETGGCGCELDYAAQTDAFFAQTLPG